jgi:histidinol dehydrogenase
MFIALARDLLSNADHNSPLYQKYENIKKCTCKVSEKTNAQNAANNGQANTQVSRQVETILYVPGGRTQYGNFLTRNELTNYLEEVKYNPYALSNGRVNFNGQFEGQPGGIRGPLRNKF